MPETTVNKDCNFRLSEHDVSPTPKIEMRPAVKAVTETRVVKRKTNTQFTPGVPPFLFDHAR